MYSYESRMNLFNQLKATPSTDEPILKNLSVEVKFTQQIFEIFYVEQWYTSELQPRKS